jgi:two-component system, cell cycle response regulator
LDPQERIEELRASDRLPSASGVAVSLMRLAQEENVCAHQIVHVLRADPALTGRVLKQANSAPYASQEKIVRVQDALLRIGAGAVTRLALGFSLLVNHRDGRCEGFSYEDYWSRSLATATAARVLARDRVGIDPEEMFTCGLLSQIGRLGLATVHPERYSRVLGSWSDEDPETLSRMEREAFGFDHNDLSAALLDDWGIPTDLVQAVKHHENPGRMKNRADGCGGAVAGLLKLARSVAEFCLAEDTRRVEFASRLFADARREGVEAEALSRVYPAVVEDWQRWCTDFVIESEGRPFPSRASQRADAGRDPWRPAEAGCRETLAGLPATDPAGETGGEWKGLRILVIDDDEMQQRMVERHLTRAGHEVRQAFNGREGLERIVQEIPQLIVTDWMMPELDGIGLCRSLRSAASTRHIYVIMLTGREDDESILEAFDAGADDYIIKPFKPRMLMAKIRAGQRIVGLQEQVESDRDQIQKYAAKLTVANRELERAALTDPLTELPNRRFAMNRLEELLARSEDGTPVSCLLIDIDNFKQVNDTLGHDVGDTVLKEVAGMLRRTVRERRQDVVCRFGGEEFLVICEGTGLAGALILAERIRTRVAATEISHEQGTRRITVSIGVAEQDPGSGNIQAMIKAADELLYEAKNSGRNRVCPAQAPDEACKNELAASGSIA